MTVERAASRIVCKPWGVTDTHPWADLRQEHQRIGEIWFERSGLFPKIPVLLLKLLFTSQPLSIQVHPDDAYAQSLGQAHGKSEAWYVLGAKPGAEVAVGLKEQMSTDGLKDALLRGSITELVRWSPVSAGTAVYVPAGTIHALGAGLTIAEIQQRSDTTYRLFDFGRTRALHVEEALAVANAGPAPPQAKPARLDRQRTVLISSPHFVLERLEVQPWATWRLNAEPETWLLVLEGEAWVEKLTLAQGQSAFIEQERPSIKTFTEPAVMLVAYARSHPTQDLLMPASTIAPTKDPSSVPFELSPSQPVSGLLP